jgi:hypothetical protein
MANGIGASLTNYQSNMLREHNRAMDLIPDKASLRRRETRFCGAETKAPKRSQQFNRQIAETKCVHKSHASTSVFPDGVGVTFQSPAALRLNSSANANTLTVKVVQGEGW